MKKIVLILTIILGSINLSYAQENQTHEEEEFEEEHDERIRNSHLNPFRNLETGEVEYEKIKEIHSFIDNKVKASKNGRVDAAIPYIEWEERGPNNYAGRIERVMVDPNNSLGNKVWAGSNSTGLYFNSDITDPNSSWTALSLLDSPQGILDITYNLANPQHFYCASFGGVYVSTDAGTNWQLLPNAPASYELLIVSSNEMYACTYADGIKKSVDGGNTWTILLKPSSNVGISGLTGIYNHFQGIKKASDGALFAISQNGVLFKSVNNGLTWSVIFSRTNNNALLSHLDIAKSTSGVSQVIYILVGDGSSASTNGLFKSVDGGNTWTQKNILTQSNPRRLAPGWFQYTLNSFIKVHPTNPNLLFLGMSHIWRTTDGGDTWDSFTNTANTTQYNIQNADYHDLDFMPSNNAAIIGHDQGAYVSTDLNSPVVITNFLNLSGVITEIRREWKSPTIYNYKNLIATQVHWGAMRQVPNDNTFAANPQDHSLKIISGSGFAPGNSTHSTGILNNNEGMWAKFDDDQPNLLLYTSMGSVHLYLKDLNTNNNLCVTCGSVSLPNPPPPSNWTTYFGGGNNCSRDYDSQTNMAIAFHYVDSSVPGRVWFRRIMNVSPTVSASTNQIIDFYIDNLFADDGVSNLSWVPALGYQDNLEFPITIKLGKTPGTLFISGMSYITPASLGHYGGVLYKVTNFMSATPTVTRLNPFTSPQNQFSSIPFMPLAIGANDNELFVPCFKATTAETLYYTNDGGTTWRNLKKAGTSAQTGLPANFSANQAVFNPLNYKQVILSTEYGIWTCDDISLPIPKWEITNAKFGKIPCRNIEIRPSDGTVMVATYGRGIFTAKLNTCQSNIVRTDVINGGVLNIPSGTYIKGNSGNSIESNGNVRYDAKTYILLEPNFEVKKGGVFQAKIGGCN